jgi:hypothetical protein
MRVFSRLTPGLLLLLAGCVSQQTTVLESSQQAALTGAAAAPAPRPVAVAPVRQGPPVQCLPPRGSGPFTPPPRMINEVHYIKPARAAAEHIAGCASVRFRVGPEGVPRDVEVLAEYPPGFGIADALTTAINEARFVPTNDLSWHYHALTFRGDK